MMGQGTGVGQNVGERAQLRGHTGDGGPPGLGPREAHISGASWRWAMSCSWVPRPPWHPPKPASLGAELLQLRLALWTHKASTGPHVSVLWWQGPRERDTVWGPNRKQQMGSCQLRDDSDVGVSVCGAGETRIATEKGWQRALTIMAAAPSRGGAFARYIYGVHWCRFFCFSPE